MSIMYKGKWITYAAAGEIIGCSDNTVSRISLQNKWTTVEEFQDKWRGARKVKHNGKFITIKDAAKIVGKSTSTVSRWLYAGYCTIDEMKLKAAKMIGQREYDTSMGRLSSRQIYNCHPHKDDLNFNAILGRLTRGCRGESDLFGPRAGSRPKVEGVVYKAPENDVVYTSNRIEFKGRTKHCFKDHQPCGYYSECGDHRFEHGSHHPRYKKSGCYRESKIKSQGGRNSMALIENPDTRAKCW